MKKAMLVFLAAFVIVAAMAGIAHAASGDSTYLIPGSTGDAGSPHGGFDVNTKRCGVCHAVHHAWGQALLRDTISNACSYCHITTYVGYIKVYDGNTSNYTSVSNKAHDSGSGASCTNCHQVHAASNQMVNNSAYLVKKILRAGAYQSGVTITGAETSTTAESKWCTQCHTYYYTGYNASSHVMTSAISAYHNTNSSVTQQVAFSASTDCRSCHADGLVNQVPTPPGTVQVASSFPHFTAGARFLRSAVTSDGAGSTPATDPSTDGVCIRCHRNGGSAGAGVSY